MSPSTGISTSNASWCNRPLRPACRTPGTSRGFCVRGHGPAHGADREGHASPLVVGRMSCWWSCIPDAPEHHGCKAVGTPPAGQAPMHSSAYVLQLSRRPGPATMIPFVICAITPLCETCRDGSLPHHAVSQRSRGRIQEGGRLPSKAHTAPRLGQCRPGHLGPRDGAGCKAMQRNDQYGRLQRTTGSALRSGTRKIPTPASPCWARAAGVGWWSERESNPRPRHCERRALAS